LVKKGDPIQNLYHESGEDILISFRTGRKAQIKNGQIVESFNAENHSDLVRQLNKWKEEEKTEEEKAAELKKVEELKKYHREAASKAAKEHLRVKEEKQKQEHSKKPFNGSAQNKKLNNIINKPIAVQKRQI
jgi:hypothetical protein